MPAHLTDSGVARLHDAMAQRVARRELPGLVTMVACGDAVHVDPIGTVAFDSDAPMRRDTVFRIASLTKPMVAVATMRLVADGRIRLDEPVDRLLPELADRRVLRRIDGPTDDTVPANRSISVDDLLTLRLGFGQITEPEFDPPYPIVHAAGSLDLTLGAPDPRTPHAPDEWMRLFGSLPLMDQPGERWRYNVGSLVLGFSWPAPAEPRSATCSMTACSGRSAWWTPDSRRRRRMRRECRPNTCPTRRPGNSRRRSSRPPIRGRRRPPSPPVPAGCSRRSTTSTHSRACCATAVVTRAGRSSRPRRWKP